MEGLISLVNQIQRACMTLDDYKGDFALSTLWEALPFVVVISGQSSRKSSVLESIVGCDFLPKGSVQTRLENFLSQTRLETLVVGCFRLSTNRPLFRRRRSRRSHWYPRASGNSTLEVTCHHLKNAIPLLEPLLLSFPTSRSKYQRARTPMPTPGSMLQHRMCPLGSTIPIGKLVHTYLLLLVTTGSVKSMAPRDPQGTPAKDLDLDGLKIAPRNIHAWQA
ncbi:hypothetical protein K1719_043392 [Acacia pycnantha]|nr:hypothetical protein K1719_043392 [Acacia pycnantha]